MSTTLRIKASQPQHTNAGDLLGRMYYSGFIDKALVHGESSGYPHNGGEHSLTLWMQRPDVEAFVDLVEQAYDGHPGLKDFTQKIREQLH